MNSPSMKESAIGVHCCVNELNPARYYIPDDTRRVDRCRVESSKYDCKCCARVISPPDVVEEDEDGGRIDPATGS
jgi:hypothetical protein